MDYRFSRLGIYESTQFPVPNPTAGRRELSANYSVKELSLGVSVRTSDENPKTPTFFVESLEG